MRSINMLLQLLQERKKLMLLTSLTLRNRLRRPLVFDIPLEGDDFGIPLIPKSVANENLGILETFRGFWLVS